MFKKILIANRGEIACRIIQSAQKMNIATVAVYSDVDAHALHVQNADEAIHIGKAPSNQSYLCIDKIIQAAQKTGAQAIHPGYGFLSENAEFAQACADNNLVFIGPPIQAIQSMGSKSAAKNIMQNAHVPLVPGYHGADQSGDKLKREADAMGYPVLLKATAGGGGKGMRQVWEAEQFFKELDIAKSEALASFGDDEMLVEKYLTQPRHVEVQVFCDQHGNAVYLFERDCSVQRRHQKIIEEAPAPALSESLRVQLGEAAVRAAKAIDYVGAGTVEFLLDQDQDGTPIFYFMEMNTRLQVEHPVTELITQQDLVQWQLEVANGHRLPCSQEDLSIHGHAFEARLYAEDSQNQFLPTSGTIEQLHWPIQNAHIRIDAGVQAGDEVTPFYDPMFAKLIVWGENREHALNRLVKCLKQTHIAGLTTNVEFLTKLADSQPFRQAQLETGFLEKYHEQVFTHSKVNPQHLLAMVALYLYLHGQNHPSPSSPWNTHPAWRLNQTPRIKRRLLINNEEQNLSASISDTGIELEYDAARIRASGVLRNTELSAYINGHATKASVLNSSLGLHFFIDGESFLISPVEADLGDQHTSPLDTHFSAPMNGTIIDIKVDKGKAVQEGDTLIVMEAMKMQHTIFAPCDGVVTELFCTTQDLVSGGEQLLEFTEKE